MANIFVNSGIMDKARLALCLTKYSTLASVSMAGIKPILIDAKKYVLGSSPTTTYSRIIVVYCTMRMICQLQYVWRITQRQLQYWIHLLELLTSSFQSSDNQLVCS